MSVTAIIYHDRKRKKNSNLYPVGHYLNSDGNFRGSGENIYPIRLRITHERKRRYYPYPVQCDLTEKDFCKVFDPKVKEGYKKIQGVLFSKKIKAEKIIESLGDSFSFALFNKSFKNPTGSSRNVFYLLDELAKKLRENNQISTAVLTECTSSSIKKFHPKDSLSFDEIDVDFLNKYEKYMLKEGNGNTAISMYLRRVRVIYNTAIGSGVIPEALYPFRSKTNTSGYQMPVGRNIKKALSPADLALIGNYKPKTSGEAKAKALWLFSFFGNGINPKDVALLKFNNIDGDMIRFERAKTIRSNKEKQVIISFHITPDMKEIIRKWGNKSVWDGNYIFPILSNNDTAEDIYKKTYNVVKTINKYMKAICKDLKITAKVTCYVARHSYGTIVRNSGRSIEFVSNQYGHGSVKTTQNYMGDYDDQPKRDVGEYLTNIINATAS